MKTATQSKIYYVPEQGDKVLLEFAELNEYDDAGQSGPDVTYIETKIIAAYNQGNGSFYIATEPVAITINGIPCKWPKYYTYEGHMYKDWWQEDKQAWKLDADLDDFEDSIAEPDDEEDEETADDGDEE